MTAFAAHNAALDDARTAYDAAVEAARVIHDAACTAAYGIFTDDWRTHTFKSTFAGHAASIAYNAALAATRDAATRAARSPAQVAADVALDAALAAVRDAAQVAADDTHRVQSLGRWHTPTTFAAKEQA